LSNVLLGRLELIDLVNRSLIVGRDVAVDLGVDCSKAVSEVVGEGVVVVDNQDHEPISVAVFLLAFHYPQMTKFC